MRRALLFLLLAHAAFAAAPKEGTLCFTASDEPCRMVRREVVRVAPRDQLRPFTWVRGDGREVVAGVLAARAQRIDLAGDTRLVATIAVAADRWPVDVGATLDERSWTIAGAAAEFALQVAGWKPGKHALLVTAAHHAPRRVEGSGDFGRIALQRLPVIAGQVVSRDGGEGLGGTRIAYGEEDVVTGARGDFELEISGAWPEHLRIEREGYAPRILPLSPVATDVDLGPISLSKGAPLEVALELPSDIRDVHVDLFTLDGEEARRIDSRTGGQSVVFPAVGAGRYRVLVRGPQPLQRYGVEVQMSEEAERLAIAIDPLDLEIRVTRKGNPVAASVDLTNRDGHWNAVVATDEEGRYRAHLWQGGAMAAIVSASEKVGTFAETSVDHDSARWDIRLPDQRIGGIVTDANTGTGIANATVFLKTDTAGSSTLRRSVSNDRGRFAFEDVEVGPQEVKVEVAGYAPGSTSFVLQAPDGDREIALALSRAVAKSLRVVLANGAPAVGAAVLTDHAGPAMQVVTDAEGRAQISIAEGTAPRVYIVPREGSFAVERLGGEGETLVHVPPGEASILIRAQDQALNSLARVAVVVAFDGEVIPPGVLRDMGEYFGHSFVTGDDGRLLLDHMPLGVYEFWPFVRSGAPQQLSAVAPARIAVQPGTNSVLLTFARRSEAR